MAPGLSVFTSLPASALFSFPPSGTPGFLAPAPPGSTRAAPPFAIPEHVYQSALDVRVPLTIASAYIATISLLNAYNRSRAKKPWTISRTRLFRAFVIAHNVFLAAYSAWTWWGMVGVMRRSIVNPLGPRGLPGLADSLCRAHGPAGLGNGPIYDEPSGAWLTFSTDTAVSLAAHGGSPNLLDAGRMWNEGLAFYGWLFYLSKFYEVLDTFIILAKGKPSSTLQTYHHAGAMMCMWSGMRFMSPPIWMFVYINSFIHAIMYTYYALSALHVRVPVVVKRALTSMQISQFVLGATFAMVHSFISFTIPIPSFSADGIAAVITKATEHANGNKTAAAAGLTAPVFDSLRSLIFHTTAAVVSAAALTSAASSSADVMEANYQSAHQEHAPPPRELPQPQYAKVPCITSTGATFAIWLNVVYLAPLTYLFGRFFVASYLRRSTAAGGTKAAVADLCDRPLGTNVIMAEKAGWDAARRVEKEMYGQDNEGADVVVAIVEEDEDPRTSNGTRILASSLGPAPSKNVPSCWTGTSQRSE